MDYLNYLYYSAIDSVFLKAFPNPPFLETFHNIINKVIQNYMSDFKYSLKTKEFSKRKLIFQKQQPQPQPSQHALSNTPLPNINDQLITDQHQQMGYDDQMREMGLIKTIFLDNERKIIDIVEKVNTLYEKTTGMYEQHEKYLREIVREKCGWFTKMMRTLMGVIDKKEQKIDVLDKKLSKFQNTLRSATDILRITKIKQDCIQARIKNFDNEDQSDFNPMIEPSLSQPLQKSKKSHESSFFLLNEPSLCSPLDEKAIQDQVSPFETNQYLLISSSVPKDDYSFEKYEDYGRIKRELEILREQKPIQGWLDEEGHLRRKNGSYILDLKGNVVECSFYGFSRLIQENLIKNTKIKQK